MQNSLRSFFHLPAVELFFVVVLCTQVGIAQHTQSSLKWEAIAGMPVLSGRNEAQAAAGAFIGIHHDRIIMAGGVDSADAQGEMPETWHDEIWMLARSGTEYCWTAVGRLPGATAFGAGVSTPAGLICIGGCNATQAFSRVLRLCFDNVQKKIRIESLPSLPTPLAFSSATLLDGIVYVAGGSSSADPHDALHSFWALDLSTEGSSTFSWQSLPAWPGPERVFPVTIAQHNGREPAVYVMSGRRAEQGCSQFFTDAYAYSPESKAWRRISDAPYPFAAAPAVSVGQSFIYIFSGNHGPLAGRQPADQPGTARQMLIYHSITDTWIVQANTPLEQPAAAAVNWGNDIMVTDSGTKPHVWRLTSTKSHTSFGALNYLVLGSYLGLLILMGWYFSSHNRSTDDFFRGGQTVPWWAAGLSIYATMLSSITYVAVPAKAYMTDWNLLFVNFTVIIVAPIVINYFLPFFRQLDVTSAYEYLEKRYSIHLRLFASASFILFQIGRMAIVMFLPALALATVTTLSVPHCIFLMGGLSILYCTLGGIRAVIWTDALQAVVLLGGAMLSLILVLAKTGQGLPGFFSEAIAFQKLNLLHWDWSWSSISTDALWVVILGGIGQNLVPYGSDAAIVQRYMSVQDVKQARRAIWLNTLLAYPSTLLFFAIGTALFVFYRHFPTHLDPSFPNDAIFPLFISREMPAGLAGLVVAGIFAAAQSTVSTSMNSTATALVTDFIRRFNLLSTERAYLHLARWATLGFGLLGTGFALWLASADIKSMWDAFMTVLGLLGGVLCGLFMLGIFSERASAAGAAIGVVLGVIGLALIQRFSSLSYLLYATVGIVLCWGFGYLASLFMPAGSKHAGLTIFSLKKQTGLFSTNDCKRE